LVSAIHDMKKRRSAANEGRLSEAQWAMRR
jgi:hypothetical protein